MTRRSTTRTDAAAPDAHPGGVPGVRVSIGELRLPGLAKREGDRLAAAFRGELATRLAGATLADRPARERIAVDRFALVAGERVEDTGRRLAIAIAGALTTTRGDSDR